MLDILYDSTPRPMAYFTLAERAKLTVTPVVQNFLDCLKENEQPGRFFTVWIRSRGVPNQIEKNLLRRSSYIPGRQRLTCLRDTLWLLRFTPDLLEPDDFFASVQAYFSGHAQVSQKTLGDFLADIR